MAGIIDQWKKMKAEKPELIYLFNFGDHYETYAEDARTIAKTLGLPLKAKIACSDVCEFPHHHLETYLKKLLANKHRVAVCDPASMSVIDRSPPAKAPKKPKTKAKPSPPAAPKPWLVIPELFHTYQVRNP